MRDDWMIRLKRAYEAGYYRTEAAEGLQTRFPWQDKVCRDCPFWQRDMCLLHGERRAGIAHTCVHFDTARLAGAAPLRGDTAGWTPQSPV